MATQVLGDLGAVLDLQFRQGSTFGPHEIVLTNPGDTPMDLTGAEIRGQLRRNPGEGNPVAFTVTFGDRTAGEFSFELSAEQTAALTPPKYIYDLELEDTLGRVIPLFHGEVIVELEVTHD